MSRRRRFRGLVKFPGLGRLPIPSSVKPTDVAVGVALGLAGGVAVAKATSALASSGTTVPDIVAQGGPIVGGVVTGLATYAVQRARKKSSAGMLIGTALGSLAVWGYQMLQSRGMLSGLVRFPGMGAPIFQNPRMSGFRGPIFDNPRIAANLGRLAAMQGTGDENEDGLFPAP